MKLRKFFGLTSRSVLEQVRAELGPDAVIVANRPTPDGIEITAVAGDAMDHMLGAPPPEAPPAEPVAATDARRSASAGGLLPTAPSSWRDGEMRRPSAEPAEIREWIPPRAEELKRNDHVSSGFAPGGAQATGSVAPAAAAPARRKGLASATVATDSDHAVDATTAAMLMQEMASMRAAFSEQIAQLAWSDALRRSPVRARFTRDLLNAGFSHTLIRDIVEHLPDDYTAAQAQQALVQTLLGKLRCVDQNEDLLTKGGVYALIGPTGVGKTTTTAKLAARCAVRYGASKLALLTTDHYRVGAHDQLRIYAKILGVAVHTVSDGQDLRQTLDSMRGKHLVLIDTVGMSQRDERVREQSMLLGQPEVKRLLLLNAASQGETLDEVVGAYGAKATDAAADASAHPLHGCIVTKLDEAARPGQALDVVMRHRLMLHYTASGQRVPEDLHSPSAEYLVHRALRRSSKPGAFALDGEAISLVTGIAAEALHA